MQNTTNSIEAEAAKKNNNNNLHMFLMPINIILFGFRIVKSLA